MNAIERAFERLSAFSVCFTDENGRAFERLLGAFERLLGAFERPPGKKKRPGRLRILTKTSLFFFRLVLVKIFTFFMLVLVDFFKAGFA